MDFSGQLHVLAPLLQGKVPPNPHQYPLDMRLIWTHSQSGCFGEVKNPLSILEIEVIPLSFSP
jgi:hypothetical protein